MLMPAQITTDPVFPSLHQALDCEYAASALRDELAGAGFPAKRLVAELERVRLKPGRKALLGLRLLGEAIDGNLIDQRLMLTLWPGGKRGHLSVVDGNSEDTPAFGPPLLQSEALSGSAWFFPNDRKVIGIARLLEQAKSFGTDIEVVHYVPEQGCTIRVDGPKGAIFGKARVDDRCLAAAKVAIGAIKQDLVGLRLAPVIEYDATNRIMWQAAVKGDALSVADLCSGPAHWADRLASAIAAFHGLSPPAQIELQTPQSTLGRIEWRAVRIRSAFPALSPDLAIVMSRLLAVAKPDSRLVLSHCDLHPANLLWDGESFALIDLDTCALAPAALDHASLAAAFAQKMLATGMSADEIWRIVEELQFAATARDAIEASDFLWNFAACLIAERLYRCGTRLKANSKAMPMQLLGLAMRALTEIGGAND
ncbi:MAG: aminoglycoside phosphotransferase family protein [Alphaproteobacteria bacterium]|nr:MAG: aminoglycoside phosphotransferase family protein [Alphaproteobacteria bacterium]